MSNKKKIETKVEQIADGVYRKIFFSKNLLVAIYDYTKGPMDEPTETHSHEYEQITYVAKGQLFVTIGGKRKHLRKGDVFYVHPNIPHSIQILSSNVRLVEAYTPIPEEFQKRLFNDTKNTEYLFITGTYFINNLYINTTDRFHI